MNPKPCQQLSIHILSPYTFGLCLNTKCASKLTPQSIVNQGPEPPFQL